MSEGFEGFNVSVRFRGLCGLVPGKAWGEPQDWVGAFLVNATPPVKRALGMQAKPHVPLLIFNLRDLENGDLYPDQKAYISLLGHDVTFVTDACTPERLEARYSAQPLGESPEASPGGDRSRGTYLNWLSQIDRAIPGVGAVREDSFAPRPQEDVLAARVHMTFGSLRADDIGASGGSSVLAQFYPYEGEGEPECGAVANSILWQAFDIRSSFTVVLRSFEPDPETGERKVSSFRFRRPASGPDGANRVALEIVNLCSDEIFGFAEGGLPEPDFDYRWMYRLSALPSAYREDPEGWEMFIAQDPRVPIPHPVRYQLKNGSMGLLLKICTSPRFEAPPQELSTSMLGLAREVAHAAGYW